MERHNELSTEIKAAYRDLGRAALHESNATPIGLFFGAEVIPMALSSAPIANPDLAGGAFLVGWVLNTAYRYLRA
jgi:hypothetical protein